MTDDERQLADLLQRSVPEPPRGIDLTQIRPARRRRLIANWLPAVAAACFIVLLLVAGYLMIRPDKRVYSPSGPSHPIASDSPTPQISPNPKGSSGEHAPDPAPQLPWSPTVMKGQHTSSLVISLGGMVFQAANKGIARIDPTTGAVKASYAGAVAWPPVLANNQVWAAQPTSSGYQIVQLDPMTLRDEGGLAGAASGDGGVTESPILAASSDGKRVALGVGPAVYLFDAVHSAETATQALGNLVTALAFSEDGTKLYAAHEGPTDSLATLDPSHGLTILADQPSRDGNFITPMVATPPGLWFGESSGHSAMVNYAPDYHLDRRVMIAPAGGGIPALIVRSDHTVWLSGLNEIACADPETGAIRGTAPIANGSSIVSIAPYGSRLIVSYVSGDQNGLAVLHPPAICGY